MKITKGKKQPKLPKQPAEGTKAAEFVGIKLADDTGQSIAVILESGKGARIDRVITTEQARLLAFELLELCDKADDIAAKYVASQHPPGLFVPPPNYPGNGKNIDADRLTVVRACLRTGMKMDHMKDVDRAMVHAVTEDGQSFYEVDDSSNAWIIASKDLTDAERPCFQRMCNRNVDCPGCKHPMALHTSQGCMHRLQQVAVGGYKLCGCTETEFRTDGVIKVDTTGIALAASEMNRIITSVHSAAGMSLPAAPPRPDVAVISKTTVPFNEDKGDWFRNGVRCPCGHDASQHKATVVGDNLLVTCGYHVPGLVDSECKCVFVTKEKVTDKLSPAGVKRFNEELAKYSKPHAHATLYGPGVQSRQVCGVIRTSNDLVSELAKGARVTAFDETKFRMCAQCERIIKMAGM